MKKKSGTILALLLAIALVLTSGWEIAPGQPGGRASAEETGFQNLNQQEIVEAMGAGWNLGNQLEANSNGTPAEDAWSGVKVTERMIRTVKTSGFKSIRIPVSYLSKIGASPNYTINKAWLDRVQEVVDWAIKYKLYVIMNIHGDGYSTVTGGWILPGASDQDTIKTKYEAVWKQIAARFKDYDHHLIFESMNEIGANILEKDGITDEEIRSAYQNINDYNQIFVDTVRQSGGSNDKRWLLVPGMNTDIDYTTGDYGFEIPEDTHRSGEIPEDQKRIMISVHYYQPWAFCGKEDYTITQWGEEGDSSKKVGYGQEDDMAKQFAKLKETFTSKGYPVVIGEYGSIDKSTKKDSGLDAWGEPDPENNKFRATYAAVLCMTSLQTGCIPVYWDNGWNGDLGFGIFDRKTYKVTQPGILEAIMSAYDKKEGTATAITLDQKTMELDMVDGAKALKASLTPADAKDMIQWESSDTTVAAVSYKGAVTPKGAGTCLITATVQGGASACCMVKVKQPKTFKAGLYANNSYDWNMLEGDNYLELTEDGGGGFTISLSGSKDQMSTLNTLFIKDVTVHREVSQTSILNSAVFEVENLQFNGRDCTMSNKTFPYEEEDEYKNDKPTGKRTVPDICMLNYWYEPANCITDLTKNEGKDNGCSFPEEYYVDGVNTITMKVTVKDAVLKKDYAPAEVPATALSLAKDGVGVHPGNVVALAATLMPENTTEKILWFSEDRSIAEVAQDGTVTGIKKGVTIVHAMTYSGQDASCRITVDENAVEEPVASPGAEPSTEPGAEPSAEPSTEPSAKPSTEPSAKPSQAPSTQPDVKPSAEPIKKPDASAGPDNQTGSKSKALSVGTAFAAGKLKYKVTSAAAGKTAVAVQGAKSKKAKSLTIPAKVSKNGTSYAVTSVGANAFKKCTKLKKITIGKNIVTIGKNAFSGCKSLKKIAVKTAKLKKVGKSALKGIHKKAVVKVPKKNLKKYRKLWKKKGQKKSVKIE